MIALVQIITHLPRVVVVLLLQAIQYISLWLFLVHLIRRLVETCCIMVYPPAARMHVIAYVFGLSYYVVAPMSMLCAAQPSQWAQVAMQGLLPHPHSYSMGDMGKGLTEGATKDFFAALLTRGASAPMALRGAWEHTMDSPARLKVALVRVHCAAQPLLMRLASS